MERIGDLEINQDLDFDRREWMWERIGWVALVAIVALAAAGLFGHGPISWTTASSDDGSLVVSYERFGRRGGSHDLKVEAAASESSDGVWDIDLSHSYVSSMEIESVRPPPEAVETTSDGLRYTFTQQEPGAALEATFSLRPRDLWKRSGEIGVADGPRVRIQQFLFP